MDFLRSGFDGFYNVIKSGVYKRTADNPELAHALFVNSLKGLEVSGLSGLVLNNSMNDVNPGYRIENGAGFNKNGEINPRMMRLLGFDSVNVGTVTADPWEGNPKPRIKRFPETGSLVNWMGLPGIGADGVAQQLEKHGYHGVPLTINLMATPGKTGNDALYDLAYTVSALRGVFYVADWELNISCPNTHGKDGRIDARAENLSQLDKMLEVVSAGKLGAQNLYLKVSPDSTEADVDDILRVAENYDVAGYVTANTTTNHDPKYITQKMEKGGASGNAVWDASVRTQKYFAERVDNRTRLKACGGINSVDRARERVKIGNCNEIQVFTELIYGGTGFVRDLRRGSNV